MKRLSPFLVIILFAGCASIPPPPPFRPSEILGIQVAPRIKMAYNHRDTATPLVTDQMILIGNQTGGLYAYDRFDGTLLWDFQIRNGVESQPTMDGDRIYVGGNDGKIYCLDLQGTKLWDYKFKGQIWSQPAVTSGIVYVSIAVDQLYALDAKTGKYLWHFKTPLKGGDPTVRALSSPRVSDSVVYIGFADGFLYAINRFDGGLIWQQQLGGGLRLKDVDATPVFDGADLFVASFDKRLFSLSKHSGSIRWSFEYGGFRPVAVEDGVLFYSSTGGEVFAMDKNTKLVKWTFKVPTGVPTQPVVVGDIVVVGGSEKNLYGIDRVTGEEVWRLETSQGFNGGLAEFQGKIYAQTDFGYLYGIDPELIVPRTTQSFARLR